MVLGPPTVIQASKIEPLYIFTDASFEPSVSFAFRCCLSRGWGPNKDRLRRVHPRCTAGSRGDSAENPIHVLEALAVVIALQAFQPFASGKGVIIFPNNDGALGSFIAC